MFDEDHTPIDDVNDLADVEDPQGVVLDMELAGYLHTVRGVHKVGAHLTFDPSDPLAVTLTYEGRSRIGDRWIFSRESLTSGLAGRVGAHGGALIWPVANEQFCCIKVGLGPVVQLDWDDVARFCDAADMLVNPVETHALVQADLDTMIDALTRAH